MDNSKIAEKILKARKDKSITQEQLANTIGISAGAVCKWETGNSVPDISMLAPLARALSISIDELLSFEPELSEDEVRNLKQELTQVFMLSGYEVGEDKCKQLLNEYPNCIFLKLVVAELYQLNAMMPDNNDETLFKTRMQSALPLLESVVESREIKYVSQALFAIASIHMILENYDESERVIKKLQEGFVDPMIIYPQLLERQGKKEETKLVCEQILLSRLNHCTSVLTILSRLSLEEGNSKQALSYIETIQKLQDTFDMGLCTGYYSLCKYYIRLNQLELSAKAFLSYIKGVVSAAYDYENNIYFKDIKLEFDPAGQKIVRNKMYQSFLESPELKQLEGLKDYEDALEILKNKLKDC